ncbi:NDP-hexose 2,3-dehydratase [Micromonospora qiuiae]|uniref:NDP-hexose 2,3-dehydratase n=1 Tax=Micromonospora qiuiae TaxID=502268 RepID=A0ABQ4JE39_9ACTN|nr:NDP-hexose 2,3-dehydratase family protein [Micromonospora qiuiae]GIJ28438.1 NDP-hexose 2,3-dehydratase [Micromonospora qiuiae]
MVLPHTEARPRPGHTDRDHLVARLARSARHRPRPVADLEAWLDARARANPFEITEVPFAELTGWSFAPHSGDLVHDSGRFFSVEGLHVRTDGGPVDEWWQPIIHQPDRAILGILAREIDGVLHFLLQAKMEPGNINGIQFSPTVQSTPSNYLRTHRGARSRYVEYFLEPGRGRVLVDVLQSEQGSWFRGKRNRNILVEVTDDIEPHPDYVWLTLGQIHDLLHRPNLVNMDARTVLSCLPGHAVAADPADSGIAAAVARSSLADDDAAWQPLLQVRNWLTANKAGRTLVAHQVPLRQVRDWHRGDVDIRHRSGRFFRIVGRAVRASNREVTQWRQPLLAPCGTGLVAFVVRRLGGVLHVLAHADLRPGYRDIVELGPTVQCTPNNFTGANRPAYLDLVCSDQVQVHYDVLQSEEGGRFHHAVTRHLVVEVGPEFPATTPPDFTWVTLRQLTAMTAFSYQVNIEARSLLLCLRALA